MKLTLGFSPCPNDCFMFDAIAHERIDLEQLEFSLQLADVEALNQAAFRAGPDVTKLSFHAYAHCLRDYVLLEAGSALGRGCGPLIVSKRGLDLETLRVGSARIAIPGVYTTANLLLGLACPGAIDRTPLVFSEIEGAVARGDFDAGVIIHESRFTYEQKGLRKVLDLGEFWEEQTGLPIPLGGIVVKRALPDDVKARVNRVVRRSVQYAFAHRAVSLPYVRAHAQEMSEDVMYRHIDLYVNEFSIDLGREGRHAVETMFERARAAGAVPSGSAPLFLSDAAGSLPSEPTAR
jgi:1,4-dihydroxy-6-naphthoate synthase